MSQVPSEWRPIQDDFRQNAHKLIAIGYRNALSKIKSGEKHQETHITGFIADAIDDWLWSDEAKGFNGFERFDDPFEKSFDNSRRGRGRLRSDLVISYSNPPRQRLICEAKRLNSGRGSEYLGDDGMGCFISGKYASRYFEVAMLGYVETKTPPEWKQILQDEIDGKAKDLELVSSQEEIQIIPEFMHEWQSKHRRDAVGTPVDIFHILLDCTRS